MGHPGVTQSLLYSIIPVTRSPVTQVHSDLCQNSGDGKTPLTAYQVINVHEEYVLLRFLHIGLPKSQSYLHQDGHAYDVITFEDPDSKEEKKMYFNVDIPAKHGL